MKANDVRETPEDLFQELTKLYGKQFQCDVACSHENTKVPGCYITQEQDALKTAWPDHWFCNPPFSELGLWFHWAWEVRTPGLMVVPSSKTEQKAWQKFIEPYRDRGFSRNGTTVLWTKCLAGRRVFLKDGKPILNKQGKVGSPRFGLTALIWEYK